MLWLWAQKQQVFDKAKPEKKVPTGMFIFPPTTYKMHKTYTVKNVRNL